MVSLEDSRTKSLADVLGNKACKKIVSYLTENKEASQKDLSLALNIPMNTMDYNIKKLLESGLIQKRKNFFWSKKGKKIVMYELSNKSIVIFPKKSLSDKFKSILPAFLVTGAMTFAVYVYEKISKVSQAVSDESTRKMVESITPSVANSLIGAGASDKVLSATVEHSSGLLYYPPSPLWVWFLGGSLLALFIISIINWRKL